MTTRFHGRKKDLTREPESKTIKVSKDGSVTNGIVMKKFFIMLVLLNLFPLYGGEFEPQTKQSSDDYLTNYEADFDNDIEEQELAAYEDIDEAYEDLKSEYGDELALEKDEDENDEAPRFAVYLE